MNTIAGNLDFGAAESSSVFETYSVDVNGARPKPVMGGKARATMAGVSAGNHGGDRMELRYLGFDQLQNARGYRFDLVAKGDATRQFVVTVDLTLFRAHAVGIQEGPSLCAQKLLADLENRLEGDHQLTTEDLRAYAHRRADAEARRIAARKAGPRRPKAPSPYPPSPWRGTRF